MPIKGKRTDFQGHDFLGYMAWVSGRVDVVLGREKCLWISFAVYGGNICLLCSEVKTGSVE